MQTNMDETMQSSILIIIPTYNEATNIADTVRTILQHTNNNPHFHTSILIMDSHSTDQTAEIAKHLSLTHSNVYLHQEKEKSGLGSAYYQAMHIALKQYQPDYIVEFDADGSHNPTYLDSMVEACHKGADAAVGSRYVSRGSSDEWTLYRKLISQGANIIARIFLSRQYHDYTSGYRMTSAQHLSMALNKPFLSNGYAYKVDLFWRLIKQGATIAEVPIEFQNRKHGCSKLPRYSIFDMLRVLFHLRFSPTHLEHE